MQQAGRQARLGAGRQQQQAGGRQAGRKTAGRNHNNNTNTKAGTVWEQGRQAVGLGLAAVSQGCCQAG